MISFTALGNGRPDPRQRRGDGLDAPVGRLPVRFGEMSAELPQRVGAPLAFTGDVYRISDVAHGSGGFADAGAQSGRRVSTTPEHSRMPVRPSLTQRNHGPVGRTDESVDSSSPRPSPRQGA